MTKEHIFNNPDERITEAEHTDRMSKQCGETCDRGFICTRLYGHTGRHEAGSGTNAGNHYIVAWWD